MTPRNAHIRSSLIHRLLLATIVVVALAPAARADDVAAIVVDRITAMRAAPRSTSHVNGTVALLVLSKADLRRTSVHGKHAVVGVSSAGDVVGVLLRANGLAVCDFGGFFDGQCLTLSGCVSGTDCL